MQDKQKRFHKLYKPVHDRFERFCRARVYGDMEYFDLMNESVLVAYEKLETLKNEEAFIYFLFGICVKILARNKRKMKPTYTNDSELLHIKDTGSGGEEQTEVRILHETLSLLPETQREALVLFEISGFSIKEIAQMQQMGESAIKQRLVRGRSKLTELLTQKEVLV